VFAADDRTGDGIIPTLGIIDEPHRLRDLALYRTWAGKIAKRDGQLATISTSGEPGSDFEETRARIRESADEVERAGSFTRYSTKRIVLHEWAVPNGADIDDMDVVKAANPFSGITKAMLTEKHGSPTMTRHHWLRFVCNRPTRDDDVWLGPDSEKIWTDLTEPFELVAKAPTWVGVDVGIKRDSTAVVAVQVRPDGRLHASCRLWVPTFDEPVDVTEVMQHLRDLSAAYKLKAISFDARFFDVPAKYLDDEGLPMLEVPQSVERMTPIIGNLYEVIRSGKLTHDDDPAFGNQVLSAVPRPSLDGRGFTLSKGKSRGRIDGAIALALAVDQASGWTKPKSPLFVGFA
jgi:phage terminase large subunit-like protein